MPIAHLPDRAVLAIGGADRVAFLQGLVSNDVAQAAPGRVVWAALLTPQGKWVADFFVGVAPDADALWLEVEAAQAPMLAARLARFRLRAAVAIMDVSAGRAVLAGWGDAAAPDGAAPDPRHPAAGWRAIVADPPIADAPAEAWDAHRLALGLPDGSRDLVAEQTVLLEAGFDELHGIGWDKGCYLGQELTARTRYRGLVKRRLVPVGIAGPLPERGTPVLREGREVGEMRSGRDARGLAVLRLEALAPGVPLRCGDATLTAEPPEWMRLPAP